MNDGTATLKHSGESLWGGLVDILIVVGEGKPSKLSK